MPIFLNLYVKLIHMAFETYVIRSDSIPKQQKIYF